MSYLLDTNICSAHFRRPAGLAHRFFQYSGRLYIPTIVLAELYSGAYHHPNPDPLLIEIEEFLEDVEILVFDQTCAKKFGIIRGNLLRQGISISAADLIIASIALTNDLTLVTHNVSDFQYIPDLHLEDWLTA
ncbi:MAG: type II toxin-antitoxin system VapC family toxin [Thermoguttaceae bacterium]|jgi:tRNA(fMet)-specific endonuclease VapC